MGSKSIFHISMVHYCHFKKKNRSLDPRDPILWPPENSRQIRDDRDSRLPAISLISNCLDPNFSNVNKIGTLGAIGCIFQSGLPL